jgi:hypothetical protein
MAWLEFGFRQVRSVFLELNRGQERNFFPFSMCRKQTLGDYHHPAAHGANSPQFKFPTDVFSLQRLVDAELHRVFAWREVDQATGPIREAIHVFVRFCRELFLGRCPPCGREFFEVRFEGHEIGPPSRLGFSFRSRLILCKNGLRQKNDREDRDGSGQRPRKSRLIHEISVQQFVSHLFPKLCSDIRIVFLSQVSSHWLLTAAGWSGLSVNALRGMFSPQWQTITI